MVIAREIGAESFGWRWDRLLRVVQRWPEGDAVDRELAALLLSGYDGLEDVYAVLEREGLDGACLGWLDLVTVGGEMLATGVRPARAVSRR